MAENKENRGGHREGAGRPKIEEGAQERRNITLSARLAAKAKDIGNGNISAGIRKALEAYGVLYELEGKI